MANMRIASYNLYEGAEHTYDQLKSFVMKEQLDVLCLQETNGWQDGNPSRLQQFAGDTGLNLFKYGDSNTRYKLATFSRLPILATTVYTEGFWHSAISTSFSYQGETLDIWNIHLNPGTEYQRKSEAKLIGGHTDPKFPLIITGDFNSLSESDQYEESVYEELQAKGISKFGEDGLNFEVMDYFSSLGLIDVAASQQNMTNTVPTPANQDAYHAADLRLDYMLVSAGLIKSIKSIEVPKNELTDVISDHYPVILTI